MQRRPGEAAGCDLDGRGLVGGASTRRRAFVDRSAVTPRRRLDGHRERPAAEKVDLLILGEGYTAASATKFLGDVPRLTGALFATEPFKNRKPTSTSARSWRRRRTGINRPNAGVVPPHPDLGANSTSSTWTVTC